MNVLKLSYLSAAVSLLLIQSPLELAAQVPSRGQKSLGTLSLEELVKVQFTTISKGTVGAFKTPAAISVMQREDILRSGATTLPDLLRLIPGVEVAQISSDRWAVGIRGFQGYLSKSMLVLIDGRSVYTPLFGGVYWEMQDTFIEDIERIEVIRGPGGTIWGANAVNGVINIITRNARETRGTLVTSGGGNVEQGYFGMRYGGGNDSSSWRLWTKGFTRGPQWHADDRNFDDWRGTQTGFRLDRTLSPASELTLTGGIYGIKAGTRLAVTTYDPPQSVAIEDNTRYYGQHVTGTWRKTLQDGGSFQLRAYYDRTDRRDLNYRETRQMVDVDFVHRTFIGIHDVTWGMGARVSPARFFQTVPTVNFMPARQTYSIYSGFAQDTIQLAANRLTAVIGVKFEHNTFSHYEAQPSMRLAWTPSEQQTYWLAVTRAVRTPSRIEDGFEFSAVIAPAVPLYVRLVGDGQFDPEVLQGYEVGYRTYLRSRGYISFSGFFNRYGNLLSVEQTPIIVEDSPAPARQVLPLLLRNGVSAQTAGFEITSLWDLKPWWRVRSSYSLAQVDARRRPESNDASTVRQLEGDTSAHKVVVQSQFTLRHGVEVDLRYRYVSAVPNQNVPGYSGGDARIAKQLTPEWELSLTGTNLFQPHHPEYGGLPGGLVEIRRAVFVKLTWEQ